MVQDGRYGISAESPGNRDEPRTRSSPILFFAALLHRRGRTVISIPAARQPPTSAGAKAALANYGFYLKESSQAAGIHFQHTSPHLDAKLDHIMEQVASMGAAVSIVDFDHDGWPDFYVTNSGEGSKNALYHNLGHGKFEDVAAQVGLADVNAAGTGVSMGAVWGDYDNDGYEDLFLYKWGKPELYHNDGGKHFTRVTEQAGLPRGSMPTPPSGSITTATANSIFSSAATTTNASTCGI